MRRDLVDFRRAAAPMREVVDAIIRQEIDFVDDEAIVALPRRLRPRPAGRSTSSRPQRDLLTGLLEAEPRGHLEPAEPGDEEDDVVGRDPHRRHAHRRHLRHELPPHARARLAVRLPAGARADGASSTVVLYRDVQAAATGCSQRSSSARSSSTTSSKLRRLPIDAAEPPADLEQHDRDPGDDRRLDEHLRRRQLQRVEVAERGRSPGSARPRPTIDADEQRLPPVERPRLEHEHPERRPR